jgi:hypothetical protein
MLLYQANEKLFFAENANMKIMSRKKCKKIVLLYFNENNLRKNANIKIAGRKNCKPNC